MRPTTILRVLSEAALAIVAPARCAACGCGVPLRHAFCVPCARSIIVCVAASSTQLGAVFVYGGAIARALVRFKYDPRPELASPLGELFRRGKAHLGAFTPELVVPVPLHPLRLAERGFNQAALLAAPLAADLGAALDARALVRTRNTPRQAMLDRARRLGNVESAFVARDPAALRGSRVLLIDDVRTTGATLRACENALRRAGAREVVSLVLAAAPDD